MLIYFNYVCFNYFIYTSGTDLGFVDTFLELQKQTLCSSDDPCFTAYDESTDGRLDLTNNVVFGRISVVSRTDRHITYILPCSVADPSGECLSWHFIYWYWTFFSLQILLQFVIIINNILFCSSFLFMCSLCSCCYIIIWDECHPCSRFWGVILCLQIPLDCGEIDIDRSTRTPLAVSAVV